MTFKYFLSYSKLSFSIFYVFYEQYLTVVHDTVLNLGLCLVAIFIVTFILLGFDFISAFLVVVVVTMIVIDICGMMYFWRIELNAVSLVNLVMVSIYYIWYITRFRFIVFNATFNNISVILWRLLLFYIILDQTITLHYTGPDNYCTLL
jgi:hypothetical protein